MKILLISDTHRRIDPINELAAATGTDCCFHLGDICTYTEDSVSRFSADMLYKQLKHTSLLSPEQLSAIDRENAESMRSLAIKYRTYGNFEEYLTGKKRFEIPIYAVPGNNDDAEVIAWLDFPQRSKTTGMGRFSDLRHRRRHRRSRSGNRSRLHFNQGANRGPGAENHGIARQEDPAHPCAAL